MEPGLQGVVRLAVPEDDEKLEIPGDQFSWEEGGEYSTNYLFIDHDTDVSVRVNVENGQAEFYDFYLDDVKLEVCDSSDIGPNNALLAHAPEDF